MSPLTVTAIGWLLGNALSAARGAQPPLALVGLGMAMALVARALVSRPLELRRAWVWRGALGVASFAAGAASLVEPTSPSPPAGLCRLVVDVEDMRQGIQQPVLGRVRVVSGERIYDHVRVPVGTRLSTAPIALPLGARVEVLAQLRPEQPFRNPSPHPALPDPAATTGHAWISERAGFRVLDQGAVWQGIESVRASIRQSLDRTLPPRSAGIARALVLGESRAVDREDNQAVRSAGLSHVLAVSGLHVTIVVGLLVACVRSLLLWTPLGLRFEVRRLACAFGIPCVLFYAPLAGGSPSAWRAAVTAAFAWALVAIGRRPNVAAVSALAAIILSVVTPSDVWNAGFVLSIAATAAIVSRVNQTDTERTWRARVRDTFALTWRAFVATTPIVIWLFGTLPWISIVSNMLLVPVASVLLLPLVTLHALLATLMPAFSAVTALPTRWTLDAFVAACAVSSHLPALAPPPLTWVQGVLLVGVSLVWLFVEGRRDLVVLTVLAALGIGVAEVHVRITERPHGVVRATFLDVGQGDSALVDLPNGQLMLIDAGGNPAGGRDPGLAVLVPLLQARRRNRIDVAVITHPHPDHYGGLRAIVESGVTIGELWDTGQSDAETPDGELSKLLSQLRARGTRVLQPSVLCRAARVFGNARARVLWPCPSYDAGHDPNDNSLVLRIDHGARSFLFTGDIEAHAEQALVASGVNLRIDVFKVPHHGSRTSSSQALLAAVSPQVAIISAGAFNRYGHPHRDVFERLRGASQRVVRLDQRGGTIVTSDGVTLTTELMRLDRHAR